MSLRTVGDQPGDYRPRYLSEWKELPQGWFIPWSKFSALTDYTNYTGQTLFRAPRFDYTTATNGLPFPSAEGNPNYIGLPYIAFDYRGQLESQRDEFIPLARGTVDAQLDGAGNPLTVNTLNDVQESPPGNSMESFSLVHIDWLTGRARLRQRELQ
jgi:hypothetical protein